MGVSGPSLFFWRGLPPSLSFRPFCFSRRKLAGQVDRAAVKTTSASLVLPVGETQEQGAQRLTARHLHLSASGPRSVKRRQDRHLPGQCLSEVARPHGVAAPTPGETRASCTPKRSRHPLVSIREYFLTRWSCNSLRPEFWLFFSEPKPNKRIGLGPRPTPRVSLSASHSVSVPSRGAGALGSV